MSYEKATLTKELSKGKKNAYLSNVKPATL